MRQALLAAALLTCAACAPTPTATAADNSELAQIFTDYFEHSLAENPEGATAYGRNDYNDRWSDVSPQGLAKSRTAAQDFLARLQAIPADNLSEQEIISRELLIYQLEQRLEGERVLVHLTPYMTLFGPHISVFVTVAQMPFNTVQDYKNLISRLNALPVYIDRHIGVLREGMDSGLTQPAYIAELLAKQTQAQAAMSPEESPLLAPLRNFPDEIPESQRKPLTEAAEAAYKRSFLPAWNKFEKFLRERYARRGRPELGLTTVEGGAEHYAFLVKNFTTTTMTPDEIHELGLREVARIEKEMLDVSIADGFLGNVAQYESKLRRDPAQRYESKEDMLIHLRNIAKIADPGLPALFNKLPRMPFGIQPIPEDREAESASNYRQPTADGSRAGMFMLKAYQPTQQVKFDKPALVMHETNPGHHLQIALQMELEGLPEFRRTYSVGAYVEGWALYAESLGHELGVYPDGPSKFGALDSERFRAKRLVTDTGLHAKGWTREQAIEYLGSESEVDRYISWPGQALGYKIGQLKIVELRDRAEEKLGDKFDLREFHHVVLRNGALPLEILERIVDDWIAKSQ